jgi:site-specific DNA recombinase
MAKNIVAEIVAVLYLRMSSDKQETSLDDQRHNLTKYAKQHGYKILREYVDEAISGDDTENRDGFLAMRQAVDSGEFSVVLCWDQDRFGRFDPLDAGYWIYPFRQGGIRLETIAQGKIDWEDLTGQLIYSVNQIGKAQFLRDLSRNTTRGLQKAARHGTAGTGGRSCYGYRSKDGEVWVIEAEAEVVRWIFVEYLKPGASLRNLAGELNRRDIAPPQGKVWRMSSVRSILARRKYTGSFVYGARNAGKYFAMRDDEIIPRRKSDKAVSAEPIVHPDKFEAIVPQETFDRVQRKLAERQGSTTRKTARQYILAGLTKCGDCNGAMGGATRNQKPCYQCRTYHSSGTTACHPNMIKEDLLVEAIVRKIQEEYLSDAAIARLRRKLEAKQDHTGPRPADLARLRREIDDLDQKIDRGTERALEAPPDLVPMLYRKLEAWQTDRNRLKTQLDALASQQARPERKSGSEIERTIGRLKTLSQAFRKASSDEIRDLLVPIVTKIELHFRHEATKGGRERSVFDYGEIHVRPDAGEARSADPNSSHMSNTGPYSRSDGRPTCPRRSPLIRNEGHFQHASACPSSAGKQSSAGLTSANRS